MKSNAKGTKKYVAPFGLVLLTITAASAVQAAHLSINDSVENVVSISHHYFENGATSNGNYFGFSTSTITTSVAGESGTFSGSWYSPGSTQNGSGIVYIVEPGTENVSDTIEATWTSNGSSATIDVTFTSSACGTNLGTLPSPGFPSVDEPDGTIGFGGSFVDVSGNPVSIPPFLGTTFTSIIVSDCDGDGVSNSLDYCPNTVIPEAVVPSSGSLGINRYALIDGDGIFDTETPNGEGPDNTYTIQDTRGCSCEQIIDELGLGKGQTKNGCSNSNMQYWINDYLP